MAQKYNLQNGAAGISDIEGKATRVGARTEPPGRERHRWANREVDMSGSTLSQSEGSDRVSMEQIRSATAASPSAKQPEHSPHDKNQYRNRENAHRHKVANGIAKNVIRISRIEAVEPVKRGRQRG
jgi:hypothetical protein